MIYCSPISCEQLPISRFLLMDDNLHLSRGKCIILVKKLDLSYRTFSDFLFFFFLRQRDEAKEICLCFRVKTCHVNAGSAVADQL